MIGLEDPVQAARCAYDQTLKRLDDVFSEDELFIRFLAKMFDDRFAKDLGRFVRLHGLKTDVMDRINVSSLDNLLSVKHMVN